MAEPPSGPGRASRRAASASRGDTGGSAADAPVTVLAADSSPISLLGLSQAIDRDAGLALVAALSDGASAVAAIRRQRPSVAVLDAYLDGSDCCEVTRLARAERLQTRVILIAERPTGDLVLQCFTAGAAGFVSRRIALDALNDAVRQVARGRSVLSPEIGTTLADALERRGETEYVVPTARELEVLSHMARGESAAAIAQSLELSVPTVKTHIQNVYVKLGVNDRGAAVATAIRRGYLE